MITLTYFLYDLFSTNVWFVSLTYLSIYIYTYVFIYLSIHLPIFLCIPELVEKISLVVKYSGTCFWSGDRGQMDLSELKTKLVYIASCRSARATRWNLVYKFINKIPSKNGHKQKILRSPGLDHPVLGSSLPKFWWTNPSSILSAMPFFDVPGSKILIVPLLSFEFYILDSPHFPKV